jgi:hypothetical protein
MLPTTNEALLDAAADVALRLRAFDSYRGSQRQAVSALKRRQPGFSQSVYEQVLQAALVLFDTTRAMVDAELRRMREGAPIEGWVDRVAHSLEVQCPGFPQSTYLELLNWIDGWYHGK